MAGYSHTPLIKKLGIKEGFTLFVQNPPEEYTSLLGSIPDNVELLDRLETGLDFIHVFAKSKKELSIFLPKSKNSIKPDGMIWVSWPKKTSKVPTDVTEDVIREMCLPMDLVDIKVCAVNDTWSGLKLVIRKGKRNL